MQCVAEWSRWAFFNVVTTFSLFFEIIYNKSKFLLNIRECSTFAWKTKAYFKWIHIIPTCLILNARYEEQHMFCAAHTSICDTTWCSRRRDTKVVASRIVDRLLTFYAHSALGLHAPPVSHVRHSSSLCLGYSLYSLSNILNRWAESSEDSECTWRFDQQNEHWTILRRWCFSKKINRWQRRYQSLYIDIRKFPKILLVRQSTCENKCATLDTLLDRRCNGMRIGLTLSTFTMTQLDSFIAVGRVINWKIIRWRQFDS